MKCQWDSMHAIVRKTLLFLVLILSVTATAGCYVGLSVGAGRLGDTHKGKVEHVVLVWLKEPGNTVLIDKLIGVSAEFRDIPGVLSVSAGRPVHSNRPIVDATFDVGFVIEFESVDALQMYEKHPAHVRAVSESLAPHARRVLVYDIER